MDFFDELRNLEFRRGSYGTFELGRWDEFGKWVIDQSMSTLLGLNSMALTPDKEQMKNLACMCYLFGLFNNYIDHFVAVPAGYIASFSYEGVFLSFYPQYIIEQAKVLCSSEQLFLEQCKRWADSKFYEKVLEILSTGDSLFNMVLDIVFLPKSDNISKRLDNALATFSKVDLDNCDKNDFILESIISDGEEELSELSLVNQIVKNSDIKTNEALKFLELYDMGSGHFDCNKIRNSKKVFDNIMEDFILNGYYIYRGKDRDGKLINQDWMILDRCSRILELKKLLKEAVPDKTEWDYIDDIIDIFNICSTDYTGPVVSEILANLINYDVKKVDEVIPTQDLDEKKKTNSRNCPFGVAFREGRTRKKSRYC